MVDPDVQDWWVSWHESEGEQNDFIPPLCRGIAVFSASVDDIICCTYLLDVMIDWLQSVSVRGYQIVGVAPPPKPIFFLCWHCVPEISFFHLFFCHLSKKKLS